LSYSLGGRGSSSRNKCRGGGGGKKGVLPDPMPGPSEKKGELERSQLYNKTINHIGGKNRPKALLARVIGKGKKKGGEGEAAKKNDVLVHAVKEKGGRAHAFRVSKCEKEKSGQRRNNRGCRTRENSREGVGTVTPEGSSEGNPNHVRSEAPVRASGKRGP